MAKKSKSPEQLRKEAIETARIVEDAMRSISSRIGDLFGEARDEVEDISNALVKDVERGLKGLLSNADAIADANERAAEGMYKQRDVAKEIAKKNKAIFVLETKIAEAKANGASNTAKMEEQLENIKNSTKAFNEELQGAADRSKEITKAMGLTGGALKGLKKVAGALGLEGIEDIFADATKSASDMAKKVTKSGQEVAGLGGKLQVAFAGASTAIGGMASALMDPLFLLGLMVKAVKELFSIFQHVLKLTSEVGQAFGKAGAEAYKLKQELHAIGDLSGDINYFTEEMLAAQRATSDIAGVNLKINEENLKTFIDMERNAGMTAEQVAAITKMSYEAGIPLNQMNEDVIAGMNAADESSGIYLNQRQIFDQLANASGSVRFNIKGGTEGLVKAAHTAARLGTTMDEIAAASKTHLDFESSIAKEIEAEMFLQKDLNLDKLRMAALTGDTATMAAEQERLIRENAPFLKGNMLAQEAFAATLGISGGELSDQLLNQEKLSNLSADQIKTKNAEIDAQATLNKEANKFDRSLQDSIKQLKAGLEPIAKKIGPKILEIVDAIGPIVKKATNLIVKFAKFFTTPLGKVIAGGVGLMLGAKAIAGLFNFKPVMNVGVLKVGAMMGGGGGGAGGGYMGGGGSGGTRYDPKTKRYRNAKGQFTKPPKTRGMKMRGRGLGGAILGLGSMLGLNYMMGGGTEDAAMMTGMAGMEVGADAVAGSMGNKSPKTSPKPKPKPKASGGILSSLGKGFRSMGSSVSGAVSGAGDFLKSGYNTVKGGVSSAMDIGAKAKDWVGGKIKGIIPKGLKAVKKPLRGILSKIPMVGAIIEAIFTGMDVNSIAKSKDMNPTEMYGEMGKSVISGGLGLTLGSLLAAAAASTQAIGIPGWLLSGAAYMGGDYLGRLLGDAIADHVGGPSLGKAIFDTFYSGAPKSGEVTELASGGIVTSATNAVVGEAGPEAVIPLREFYAKFDELIAAVNKGGNVYLDGNKVGYSLALQSSQMG